MKKVKFLETEFGTLFYCNIYSYCDKPLMFTAFNEDKHFFFCYNLGLDDEQENELWLITPISMETIQRLEQKEIPIIDVLKSKNEIKLIKLNINTGKKSEEWISTKFNDFLMPKDNVFINEILNIDI